MGMTTESITWHEIQKDGSGRKPREGDPILIKTHFGEIHLGMYAETHWWRFIGNAHDQLGSKWVSFWAYMPEGPK